MSLKKCTSSTNYSANQNRNSVTTQLSDIEFANLEPMRSSSPTLSCCKISKMVFIRVSRKQKLLPPIQA